MGMNSWLHIEEHGCGFDSTECRVVPSIEEHVDGFGNLSIHKESVALNKNDVYKRVGECRILTPFRRVRAFRIVATEKDQRTSGETNLPMK